MIARKDELEKIIAEANEDDCIKIMTMAVDKIDYLRSIQGIKELRESSYWS